MNKNQTIPEIVFDGFTVYQHLTEDQRRRTSGENVSDVLDALVRAMKEQGATREKDNAP